MLTFIGFLVAILSSFIGSISGIGGGIIIKPVLDLTGKLPIDTVNFLSGTTVLLMTIVSLLQYVIRNAKRNGIQIISGSTLDSNESSGLNMRLILLLCLGSIFGGFLGTQLFSKFLSILAQEPAVLIQAVLILLITIIVMLYQWNIKRIKPLASKTWWSELLVGFLLGAISSFLGIGGGPLNVAILAYVFALTPKKSALSSLAVIFSAQAVSFISTVSQNLVPLFSPAVLIVMALSGVAGALIGRFVAARMDENKTRSFFNIALWLILAINLYNVIRQWISL